VCVPVVTKFFFVFLSNATDKNKNVFFGSFFLDCFFVNKMRGATRSIPTRLDDHAQHITLKIWSKTGSNFEDIFAINRTTFADVKCSAIQHLLTNNNNVSNSRRRSNTNAMPLEEIDNYKLISIESKRTVNEQKTLGEERAKDGGQFID
jgi:hypothetical protein